jgi:hypothetical protein
MRIAIKFMMKAHVSSRSLIVNLIENFIAFSRSGRTDEDHD